MQRPPNFGTTQQRRMEHVDMLPYSHKPTTMTVTPRRRSTTRRFPTYYGQQHLHEVLHHQFHLFFLVSDPDYASSARMTPASTVAPVFLFNFGVLPTKDAPMTTSLVHGQALQA
jgi:hypothetical protein